MDRQDLLHSSIGEAPNVCLACIQEIRFSGARVRRDYRRQLGFGGIIDPAPDYSLSTVLRPEANEFRASRQGHCHSGLLRVS